MRFVTLLRHRLLISRDVAESKFNSGAPIEDKKREASLLLAMMKGVTTNRGFAIRVLKDQIEASKIAQMRFVAKWAGHPPFTHPPDLANEIRPKLDSLTASIVRMLPAVEKTRRTALARAASAIRWPKQDQDCFEPAWRVAISSFVAK
jgi:chorismate mutase